MINQVVVDNTRQRTRNTWVAAGKSAIPTPVLDLLAVMLQRIEDLEEQAGYTAAVTKSATEVLHAMDTQGR